MQYSTSAQDFLHEPCDQAGPSQCLYYCTCRAGQHWCNERCIRFPAHRIDQCAGQRSEKQPALFCERGRAGRLTTVTTCNFKASTLPLIFWEVLSSIKDLLGVRRHGITIMQVVGLDKKGNALRRTVEASADFITVRKVFHFGWVPFFQGVSSSNSVFMARERPPLRMCMTSWGRRPSLFRISSFPSSSMASKMSEKPFWRYIHYQNLNSARLQRKPTRTSWLALSRFTVSIELLPEAARCIGVVGQGSYRRSGWSSLRPSLQNWLDCRVRIIRV